MGRIGKVLGFSRLKETALRHSEWDADGSRARMRIWFERRVIRGYECSGCGRRTWRVRDAKQRTWDDLPWAAHPVTLVYAQRRVR
jgi:transposase